MKLIMISLVAALATIGALASGAMEPAPLANTDAAPAWMYLKAYRQAVPAAAAQQPDSQPDQEPGAQTADTASSGADQELGQVVEPTTTPIPETVELPESLLVRLPMDDYYYSQLTDTDRANTCGPTALMMILDYFNLETSLEMVIRKHEFPAAQGGYDASCTANPVCTSPGALARVATEDYGLVVDAREGWTFEQVRQSLSAGRPLIADIAWQLRDEGPGHFVVIYGIDPDRRTITYHDPYYGADKTANWEEFSAAWDGPVDRSDPLQPEGHRFWAMGIGVE